MWIVFVREVTAPAVTRERKDSCGKEWLDPSPQAQKAIRRDEHDRQKDKPDQRVEALGADDIDGEGLDQDHEQRRR